MIKEKGFTLIEILIVLGIIALLASVATKSPKSPQKEYKRFFRRFSLMSKKIRNQAMVESATYRIVLNLEEDKPPEVWIEKTSKPILLGDEKETREKFKEILKARKNKKTQKKDSEKKNPNPDGFKTTNRFNFRKLKMPNNLRIKQIEVSGIDYEITEGIAFYHYFPQGLVEEAAIQFTDLNKDYKSTLISDSISGEIYFISGHKSLEELQER